ncbi:MAG: pyridoxamine 5'-phosphate oxidase family protein [Acidimicrobiales bacterium]
MQPSDCTITDSATSTSLGSARTTLKRLPARGHHDPASVHGVLDEALVGHLAFVHDGTPFALPTIHARVGDVLYVHGSVASRMLRSATSQTVCFTATIVDGLVVARSAFHHSLNYRSAVVLGVPRRVEDPDEQRAALDAIVDHVLPGRPAEVRAHHDTEVRTTRVLALAIDEASAKVRTGDPIDEPDDLAGDGWAGVVPVHLGYGTPTPAADLRAELHASVPASVSAMAAP